MKDPDEQLAYDQRKIDKANKRRSTSSFNYESAGGNYIPTKIQYDFCFKNFHLFLTQDEKAAANEVMYGYSCNEKIHHDYIYIVNEKIRNK
jgi:hypothetical protein